MKINTSIKLDKEIKEQASQIASELGLSLSSVVNATLKKFVTERRVTFSLEPEFNSKTAAEFRKLRTDVKNDKQLVGSFESIGALRDSLER